MGEREAFERFGFELERVSGRLEVVVDADAARVWVEALAAGREIAWLDDAPSEADLRRAAVGVDEADFLIAETGTIVRTFPSPGVARISLVPPISVFLARPEALVSDLPAALAQLEDIHRAGRAATVLITGPSRTADIEKQLVIPAHGPRELVVLWVGADPRA